MSTRSALMSTLRTPLTCGPTAERNDHGRVVFSSPTLSAMPPPLGRRTLSVMFSKLQ